MACPECGCKETYPISVDVWECPDAEYLERCAHCNFIFDAELEGVEDDEPDIEDY